MVGKYYNVKILITRCFCKVCCVKGRHHNSYKGKQLSNGDNNENLLHESS